MKLISGKFIDSHFEKCEKQRIQNLNNLGKIRVKKNDVLKKMNFEKGKFVFNKNINKQFLTTNMKKTRKKEQKDFLKDLNIKYENFPCLIDDNSNFKSIEDFIFNLDKYYNIKYLQLKTNINNNLNVNEKKNKNEKNKIPLNLFLMDDFFSIKSVDNVLYKILFFIFFSSSKFKIEILSKYKNKILTNNNKKIWEYYYKKIPEIQFKEKEVSFKFNPNIKKETIINKLDFTGLNNFEFIYGKNIISYFKDERKLNYEININKSKHISSVEYLKNIKVNKLKSLEIYEKLPQIFFPNENPFKIIENIEKKKETINDLNFMFSNETTTKIINLNSDNLIKNIKLTPLKLSDISKTINLNSPFSFNSKKEQISYKTIPEISFSKIKRKRPYKIIKEKDKKWIKDNYYIFLNSNTMNNYINEKKNHFLNFSLFKENIDIIFDISICGIIIFSSELNDEFDFSVYNEIFEIINDCYLKFSTFYFIIIDDEINKRIQHYNINSLLKKLNNFLNEKFKIILSKKEFNLSFNFINIKTTNQIFETLINVIQEIKGKKDINKYSIFNLSKFTFVNKILYDNLDKYHNISYLKKVYTKESYIYLNSLESILLEEIKDLELKKEIISMIIEKYNNKHINIELNE